MSALSCAKGACLRPRATLLKRTAGATHAIHLTPHSVVMRAPPRRFGIRSTPAFMTFLPPDDDGEVHRGERDIYSWREVGAPPEPTAKLIMQPYTYRADCT